MNGEKTALYHLFPNEKVSRNYKNKEHEVINYLKEHYNEYDIVYDRMISNGCSKRRPDMFIELLSHVIIIEIDENQHIEYDCSCENKRIMELSRDIDHRPLVFIRFNPDEYIMPNGTKKRSCFVTKSTGYTILRKDTTEWYTRLNELKSCINYWIKNIPPKTIEIIQLFYDQN